MKLAPLNATPNIKNKPLIILTIIMKGDKKLKLFPLGMYSKKIEKIIKNQKQVLETSNFVTLLDLFSICLLYLKGIFAFRPV